MRMREEDLPVWAREQIARKLETNRTERIAEKAKEPDVMDEGPLRDGPDDRLPLTITIPLDPRTKKNSPRIFGTGKKCAVCGKSQKQWVAQSAANVAYTKAAKEYVKWFGAPPLSGRLNIKCEFYMKTRRKVDLLNLMASVCDLLTECGVIEDDNANIVVSHDGSRVHHDPHTPRTEITITQVMEEVE